MNAETSSTRLLIVADDLTGAADCSARCYAAGLPTRILLEPPVGDLPAGATAFTTDSRHLPPQEAAQRVREAIAHFASSPNVRWYKKIDSTLRGNIGAELDAMLDVLSDAGSAACAIVCPAFPAQGRGLAGGRLVRQGIEADGPDLPALLRRQSRRPAGWIALGKVREGTAALVRSMADLRANGVQLIVADAMTDGDLTSVYAASRQALPDALFCGSAGLVQLLAKEMAERPEIAGADDQRTAAPSALANTVRPIIVAVGSGSEMAHRQIAELSNLHHVCTQVIQPDARKKRQRASEDIAVVLYHLPPPAPGTKLEGEQARRSASTLADEVVHSVFERDAGALVLVGGDTAMHVLRRLGVSALEVCGEIEPGMPISRGADRQGRVRTVVLKAGNHGVPDSLVEIVHHLRGELYCIDEATD